MVIFWYLRTIYHLTMYNILKPSSFVQINHYFFCKLFPSCLMYDIALLRVKKCLNIYYMYPVYNIKIINWIRMKHFVL